MSVCKCSDAWRSAVQGTHGVEKKSIRLAEAIASDIEKGSLSPNVQLLSQRTLAAELEVSVQTVNDAYRRLERTGLIFCEPGRGSFVAPRVTEAMPNYILDTTVPGIVDLSTVRMIRLAEHDTAWREACLRLASLGEQPWIHASRPAAGLQHHRLAGVTWLSSLNLPTDEDSLLVTNGTTHSMYLALNSIVQPGDTVLTEQLTNPNIIGAAGVLGFVLKGLDCDEQGIIPDHFEEICAAERVAAIVCTPTFSIPTVTLMPETRRRRIARIADRYGVYVIEDDIYGALLNKPALPIASIVPDLGFYCTSMTKTVLNGLRTGYLVVPRRCARRVESVLRVSAWMATPAMAEIAAQWTIDGTARRLIELQRCRLATRQAMLQDILKDHIIGAHPNALSVWLGVPDCWKADSIVRNLMSQQIAVTARDPFVVPGAQRPNALRVCIGAEVSDLSYKTALETIAHTFGRVPHGRDHS